MIHYHKTSRGWQCSPEQLPIADFAAWRTPTSHQQTCIQGAIICFTDTMPSQAGGGSPMLFHRGYKWIRFMDFGTLKIYRKKADELHRLKPCDLKPKPVARKLEAKRKLYRKLGLGFPKRALQQAMDELRKQGS